MTIDGMHGKETSLAAHTVQSGWEVGAEHLGYTVLGEAITTHVPLFSISTFN